MSDRRVSLSDMPKFTVRFNDTEVAQLDRLTAAVKARYQEMSVTMPIFSEMARDTTRSSALRALLAAWDHGQADTAFNPSNDTEKPS